MIRPMQPTEDDLKGLPADGGLRFVEYGKNQPEYLPLPALVSESGLVTTRWKIPFTERLAIFWRGEIWLQVLTFHKPLQQVKLLAKKPTLEECV